MKRYCLQGLCSTPEDHWSPQGGPERTEPYIMTVHRRSHSIAALASLYAGGDGGRVLPKIWSHGYNAQVNVNINISQSFWLFCAICAWYCDIMLNCLFNWAWQCREYSTETCIVKLGESQVPVLKIKNNTSSSTLGLGPPNLAVDQRYWLSLSGWPDNAAFSLRVSNPGFSEPPNPTYL